MITQRTHTPSESKHYIIRGNCSHSTAESRDANKPVLGNADYKKPIHSYQDRGLRLQDLLIPHAVVKSRDKRSDDDRKPLSYAQVSATTGRHIGQETRGEFEFVGTTSVHETNFL
jgi:hypothetical protein